jgi:hypothetical protein
MCQILEQYEEYNDGKCLDKFTSLMKDEENTSKLKHYGKMLYHLEHYRLLNVESIEDNIYVQIGFIQENRNTEDKLNPTSEYFLTQLDNKVSNNEIESKLTVCLINNLHKTMKCKVDTKENRLESRSQSLWKQYIQHAGLTATTYNVIEMPVKYKLSTLITESHLNEVFSSRNDITAFSLFQKGEPKWEKNIGGGRYIIKSKDWKPKYFQIFEWLKTLERSVETLELLNIICGFRFKIIPVQSIYTIEVWFAPIKHKESKSSKAYVLKLRKMLENKLKEIFTDCQVKVGFFAKPKQKFQRKYNGKFTGKKYHPRSRS